MTCEFRANVTEQKECVVIWHRRTEQRLNSTKTRDFALIPLSEAGDYYFVVFGKKGANIEEQPFLQKIVKSGKLTCMCLSGSVMSNHVL